MRGVRRAVGIFGLAAMATAGQAVAQSAGGISIRAYGSGLSTLSSMDLNQVYDAKFGTGFGGGLGYRVTDIFTVRADANATSAELQARGVDQGSNLDRTFVSAIAQFQLPRDRIRPYLMTGLGAVRRTHEGSATTERWDGHWLAGLGIDVPVGGSGLSVAAESRMYVYQTKGLVNNPVSQKRVMTDAAVSAGLVYRFGGAN